MTRRFRLLLAMAAAPAAVLAQPPSPASTQPTLGARSAPLVESSGWRFRDLNRNGTLDPYEDWRRMPDARARDLVSRMTLEEKAGAMMHGTARIAGPMGMVGVGAAYDTAAARALIDGAHKGLVQQRARHWFGHKV